MQRPERLLQPVHSRPRLVSESQLYRELCWPVLRQHPVLRPRSLLQQRQVQTMSAAASELCFVPDFERISRSARQLRTTFECAYSRSFCESVSQPDLRTDCRSFADTIRITL